MKKILSIPSFIFLFTLLSCHLLAVKGEIFLSPGFQPAQFKHLAILNLDPKIRFAEYVEAELIKKGYTIKEEALVRQMLKKEGLERKDESFNLEELARIGKLLNVQGIVFCRVVDFSRFRDFYRLQIKMISTETGNTIWIAHGSMEGKRGEKPGELLKQIVSYSLKDLPEVSPASH